MSYTCKWLHNQLEQLPLIGYSFSKELPHNGIYFFYESGEIWGHGGNKLRIVRVGTHRAGNFGSRIREHYLLDELNLDINKPKPSDRSIFRKNIGRALLNKVNDNYLKVWEIKFLNKENRVSFGQKRDIEKEKKIELEITKLLKDNFKFRYIILDNQIDRMGSKGLESSLIGTLANCGLCKHSLNWIGKYSTEEKIKESGLWQVQHLKSRIINEKDKNTILKAIDKTKDWIKKHDC